MSAIQGCTGKVRHATKTGAIIAVKKANHAQMSVYRCRNCKGWHLGKSNHWGKINARLDQLLGKADQP